MRERRRRTARCPVSSFQTRTPRSAAPEHDGDNSHPTGPQDGQPHVPGEPGIWILLFGDLAVFATLFSIYSFHRAGEKEIFAQSQQHLNPTLGGTNTIVLLTSSLMLAFAARAIRRDDLRKLAAPLTVATIGLGLCFVGLKFVEYHSLLSKGFTPATNQFFMYYFVLTGLHLGHVLIGLGVLLALLRLAKKPAPSATHIAFFEGGACFWHMVDLLWLVIFPLLFLVR